MCYYDTISDLLAPYVRFHEVTKLASNPCFISDKLRDLRITKLLEDTSFMLEVVVIRTFEWGFL